MSQQGVVYAFVGGEGGAAGYKKGAATCHALTHVDEKMVLQKGKQRGVTLSPAAHSHLVAASHVVSTARCCVESCRRAACMAIDAGTRECLPAFIRRIGSHHPLRRGGRNVGNEKIGVAAQLCPRHRRSEERHYCLLLLQPLQRFVRQAGIDHYRHCRLRLQSFVVEFLGLLFAVPNEIAPQVEFAGTLVGGNVVRCVAHLHHSFV